MVKHYEIHSTLYCQVCHFVWVDLGWADLLYTKRGDMCTKVRKYQNKKTHK